MTSLLPGSSSPSTASSDSSITPDSPRRPLVLLATLAGVTAASGTLVVCLAIGVVGWFAADAGAHGTPSDGLRVAALGWLLGHGSGLHVQGAVITVVPLGLTLLFAWTIWRLGHKLGDAVSGHGPDADRLADGERDWTVLVATAVFAAGYLMVAVLTVVIASTPEAQPSLARVVAWSLGLCLVVGGPAIAIGSGRAAVWTALVPLPVRAALSTCSGIVLGFVALSASALAVSLVLDFGTAANVLSRLHTSPGDAAIFTLLTALVTPNAIAFSGAYLLGPGFSIGTSTVVSPTLVALGPVPMFPLLAALPDEGPTSTWTVSLIALPFLVAAVSAALDHLKHPTLAWDQAALRGCAGGVLAGIVFGIVATVAGGAAGPGRMTDVSPFAFDVLVHGITAFGIGGLLGGVAMTGFARWRGARAGDG